MLRGAGEPQALRRGLGELRVTLCSGRDASHVDLELLVLAQLPGPQCGTSNPNRGGTARWF